MAVLLRSKQLERIQGDGLPGRVTEVPLSLTDGDDNASAEAYLTLDPLPLEPVVEAQSGRQRLVIASAQCPNQAGVDIIVEITHHDGWWLFAEGKPRLRAVGWPRLLEYLPGEQTGNQLSPRRHHGTTRSGACSVVPPLMPS